MAGGSDGSGVMGATPKQKAKAPGAGAFSDDESLPARETSSRTRRRLAERLGLNVHLPDHIEDIMLDVNEDDVEEILRQAEEGLNRKREPFYVCEPQFNLTDEKSPYYDPNFTTPPTTFTQLKKPIRDIWRRWSGRWTDQRGDILP